MRQHEHVEEEFCDGWVPVFFDWARHMERDAADRANPELLVVPTAECQVKEGAQGLCSSMEISDRQGARIPLDPNFSKG